MADKIDDFSIFTKRALKDLKAKAMNVERWTILARSDEEPEMEIICFVWRGSASEGIARAQRDALIHGEDDLRHFWAEPYNG